MSKKKKIALIVDADNWAFANIARNIVKNIGEYYDFKIIPSQYFEDNLVRVLLLTEEYDLIHFFWRGKLLDFEYFITHDYIHSLGYEVEEFKEKYFNNKIITTSVYDHLFIEDNFELTSKIVDTCDKYYVSSNRLKKIYDNLSLNKKPSTVITDGVDLSTFYPKKTERFDNIKNREIVIGWVGNSAWESGKEDFKGVNTILKPAIKELQEEGYPITTYFADKQERMIPHDKMVDYYSDIDLYICTSKIEGTPNPILESMACGIPVISTDVGIVPDVFGKKQREFILKTRSVECLKEAIKKMIKDEKVMKELIDENLEQIKEWTWQKISYQMKDFFETALKEIKK